MKKRGFSRAKRFRAPNSLRREVKLLKKLRHKRARRALNPQLVYKTTGAWDIN